MSLLAGYFSSCICCNSWFDCVVSQHRRGREEWRKGIVTWKGRSKANGHHPQLPGKLLSSTPQLSIKSKRGGKTLTMILPALLWIHSTCNNAPLPWQNVAINLPPCNIWPSFVAMQSIDCYNQSEKQDCKVLNLNLLYVSYNVLEFYEKSVLLWS